MKRLTRPDELLLKLAEGSISEIEHKELLQVTDKSLLEGYLTVIDLEDDLSNIDSTLPVDFEARVLGGIAERTNEKRALKEALYGSFKHTFIGLTALILVIGPSQIMSRISSSLTISTEVVIANSFQAASIVATEQAPITNAKNEVTVLIELVDGATKQKEFVTAVLRVNTKSPGQASLLLPRYEATVLKEFERRVAL